MRSRGIRKATWALFDSEEEGLIDEVGIGAATVESVELSPTERTSYGVWQRVSLADGHLERVALIRASSLYCWLTDQ